jgi:5'-nucleotidase (lipoprotein e(P4) family)
MRQPLLILFTSLVLFIHCKSQKNKEVEQAHNTYLIQSVLWQQNAAERRALAYQSYRLARLQFDNILAGIHEQKSRLAVVTDIDETVLDNSALDARLIKKDQPYSKDLWLEWEALGLADTIPGALSFFSEVAKKGIEIFYISNRSAGQLPATIKNLKKFAFPFADETHVLLQAETSNKQPRREEVLRTHQIVLLLGDNLSDFSSLFYNQKSARRNALVDSMKASFGTRFILFANPTYGDWETQGIFEGKYDWTRAQKDSIRFSKLHAY